MKYYRAGGGGSKWKNIKKMLFNIFNICTIYLFYLCFSVNSRYSSLGFILFIALSIRFCISLNLSEVKSLCWLASCKIFFHSNIKLSCTDCWCSNRPGNNMVRKSFSTSMASVIDKTYSLWVKCNLRQAFWYLSRTSSNLRPPRPAGRKN